MMRCFVLACLCLVLAVPRPAAAQLVSEQGGQVLYQFGEDVFVICDDGVLLGDGYTALLDSYMKFTVANGLIERYLKTYERQNSRTRGALDDIVAEQRAMTLPDQLEVFYEPHRAHLALPDYFKLQVLNATAVTAQLSQKLGPAKVRLLCNTGI